MYGIVDVVFRPRGPENQGDLQVRDAQLVVTTDEPLPEKRQALMRALMVLFPCTTVHARPQSDGNDYRIELTSSVFEVPYDWDILGEEGLSRAIGELQYCQSVAKGELPGQLLLRFAFEPLPFAFQNSLSQAFPGLSNPVYMGNRVLSVFVSDPKQFVKLLGEGAAAAPYDNLVNQTLREPFAS